MDNQNQPRIVPQPNKEEEYIEKIKQKSNKRFLDSPKFQEWYRLFTDRTNKETFGNATRSALIAYNLDEKEQYWSGATIGKENAKKLQNVAFEILSRKGVTHATMLDIGFNKMLKSSNFDSWFMFMEMLGMEVPKYKPVSSPTVYLQQNNNIEGGVTVYGQLTDEQLDAVIESKRRKIGVIATSSGEGEKNSSQSPQVHSNPQQAIRGEIIEETNP